MAAWRKGALVCAAPEIIYAEDTDGDGKADLRRVLFKGFATENYQARVNGLSYALDNWVYGANGLIGGTIRGTATGRDVNIGGRDFRIDPNSGVMEPASGLTQQGRVHDDWGNQFGGNNSVLIQHYPLPDHYASRNRWVAAPSPAVYLPRDEDSTRLFPASVTAARYNHPESANRVTSACGIGIYRDDLLGPSYKGNAFICEPVHNLVRREVLGAVRRNLRLAQAGRRRGGRVLLVHRPVVPTRPGPHRSRRRAMGRGHAPVRHRAPPMDQPRPAGADSTSARGPTKGRIYTDLSREGKALRQGRSPVSTASRRGTSLPRSTARTARFATTSSACWPTGRTRPLSRF